MGLPAELERAKAPPPRCPLCASGDFRPFRFGLISCTGCRLVLNPLVFSPGFARSANLDAFGDSYEPERSFWVRVFHTWKCRRYLTFLARAGVLGGELLEVGVGSGAFLDAARKRGFRVTGCDLSPQICQRVQARYGFPVLSEDLANLPRSRWDVVVMSHVLEHVEDPVRFLRAARERLKSGGLLFLALPNIDCVEALFAGWNYYLAVHLTYFSPTTLRNTLRKAGFQPVALRTCENFSTWFLTGLRTLLGINSANSKPEYAASLGRVPSWWRYAEHPYRLAMVMTGAVTWPVRSLQARAGRGDEIIALARSS